MSALIFALVLSAVGNPQLTPPEQLSAILRLTLNGKGGQAVPISPTLMLSAKHVCANGPEQDWHSRMQDGKATVITQIKDRDVCALVSATPVMHWVTLSKRKPNPGERLWWLVMLEDGTLMPIHGYYLGPAIDGHMHYLDGGVYPGSSGSAVMNEDGEVVGIIAGSVWWPPGTTNSWRALGRYESVVGGWK